MKLLKILEEKLLFNFTRYIFLVFIGLLSLALIGLGLSFFVKAEDTVVTYDEATQFLRTDNNPQDDQSDSVKVPIPANLDQYFVAANRKTLFSWMGPLDKEQQQDFFQNLSTIISQMENDPKIFKIDDGYSDKVYKVINEFAKLKLGRLNTSKIEKNEVRTQAVIRGIFALLILALIGLFTLILVLLAVERNTRKSDGF